MLLQHPHRSGSAEHRGDFVLFDQAPPDAGIGPGRQSFEHDRGHAGNQRTIDDVAVAHHPTDVAGGEEGLARLAAEDVLHAGRQGHRVAADVALHALRPAGGAAGVERVARLVRFEPDARYLCPEVTLAQNRVIDIALRRHWHRAQAAVDHQHPGRLVFRQANGFVKQGLVRHHLARAAAGIGTDDHSRLGIVDAAGQADAGEASKHDRVDRTDAGAREHRECRLGNHRHVDEHTVALPDAEFPQDSGHALHFDVQFAEAVDMLLIRFCRDEYQRVGIRPRSGVPIDRVVAQVGKATYEPARKRRLAVVAHLLKRLMPVDQASLLGPETVAVGQRTLMEVGIGRH